jgi:biopolymer transport protein ExbD/biopolymer transport protein TolR
MVDVMLVLLIIFMIVTPLLQQGVTVNIPKETMSPDEDGDITKDTSVVISIPDNNNFYVGKDPFPLTSLGEKIQTMMKDKAPDKRIVYIKRLITVPSWRRSISFASRISIRSVSSQTRRRESRLRRANQSP